MDKLTDLCGNWLLPIDYINIICRIKLFLTDRLRTTGLRRAPRALRSHLTTQTLSTIPKTLSPQPPKPETLSPNPRKSKPETRNSKPETQTSKPETRNSKPET